jgi:alpha-L-rhamnosidase
MDTPQELVSQWCYYHGTAMLSNIASLIGKQQDADIFAERAEKIKDVFNNNFLREDCYIGDEHHAQYLKFIPPQVTEEERTVMEEHLARTLEVRSQTGHVLALYLDLVPAEKKQAVLQSLIDDIVVLHGKHVNTGIIGTRYLLDVLSDNGYADLAFQLVTQTTYPGWGYMVKEGATTLWERWEYLTETGMNSQNHIMLGSVDAWFYRYLAGIQIDPAAPGWKSFRIRPHVLGDLQFVSASVQTVRGLVASRWNKGHHSLEFHVTVPVNSQATVNIPKISLEHVVITKGETVIWKDGRTGQHVAGLSDGREERDAVTFDVGSGTYCFVVRERADHR